MKKYIPLIIISLLCLVTAACTAGDLKMTFFKFSDAEESQWAATLNFKGESIPLSVVLVTSKNYDKQARLVVLSPFGASLGDCWLSDVSQGQFICQGTYAGADSSVAKLSRAVQDLLERDSSFLLKPNYDKNSIKGSGWKAAWETKNKLVYSRLKPQPWSLTLTRAGVKP